MPCLMIYELIRSFCKINPPYIKLEVLVREKKLLFFRTGLCNFNIKSCGAMFGFIYIYKSPFQADSKELFYFITFRSQVAC